MKNFLTKMTHKYRWYYFRWKPMSHPEEDIYRIKQYFQLRIKDSFYRIYVPSSNNFIYVGSNIKYSIKSLYHFMNHNLENIRIFQNKLNLSELDNWRKDYKNNIVSPQRSFHKIDKNSFELVGELKYALEPSRMQHLTELAAKYVCSNNRDIYDIIESHIFNWSLQNPYLKSINWKDGIEVGIRVTNLIVCRKILTLNEKTSNKRLFEKIDQLVYIHYHYLINHLSLFSSANNHLLAEILGVIIVSIFYDFNKNKSNLNKYWEMLMREINNQIHLDGFNKEQSTCYHADSINIIVLVIILLRDKGYNIPKSILIKIRKMILFLSDLRINDSMFIDIGDNDNSEIIYPYFTSNYNKYESILIDGLLLFNIKKTSSYEFDFKNYLLWGDDCFNKYLANYQKPISNKKNHCTLYSESGYYIFNISDSKLIFDVGDIGLEPLAAHGHSDLLHFTLYYKGIPFLIDTGTYQYHNRYKKWRDYFRSISAHNTISIDSLNHSQIKGNMIWHLLPKAIIHDYSINVNNPYCLASHNGFELQKKRIKHYRNIAFKDNKYVITDKIQGKGNHTIDYYLQFNPDLKEIKFVNETELILLAKNNTCVKIKNKHFDKAKIYYGEESIPLGWLSDEYDKINPTYCLLLKTEFPKISEIKTELQLN